MSAHSGQISIIYIAASEAIGLFVTGKTDIGKFRKENQDRFRLSMLSDDSAFAVVCDGMGGAASGGLASDISANAVYERIQLSFRSDMEPKSIKSLLLSSISAANTLVYNKSKASPENEGMGTTCVCAVIHNGLCCIASVGDSRAYILNESGIKQIKSDHTMVEYLHSKGLIDESEMKVHRMKNVITRAVGVDETVEADYFELDVHPGEYILICTDGLTNYVSDEVIFGTVYHQPLEQAATELVERANSLGGKDNITVVLAAM